MEKQPLDNSSPNFCSWPSPPTSPASAYADAVFREVEISEFDFPEIEHPMENFTNFMEFSGPRMLSYDVTDELWNVEIPQPDFPGIDQSLEASWPSVACEVLLIPEEQGNPEREEEEEKEKAVKPWIEIGDLESESSLGFPSLELSLGSDWENSWSPPPLSWMGSRHEHEHELNLELSLAPPGTMSVKRVC
ncbi:hypothetical protein Dimus_015047 [Dionaea muscipula]